MGKNVGKDLVGKNIYSKNIAISRTQPSTAATRWYPRIACGAEMPVNLPVKVVRCCSNIELALLKLEGHHVAIMTATKEMPNELEDNVEDTCVH